jgi:oxepin-CoA hydrolase / 3-oxo-5,6-dehydrosuberyl-CoA semialdehyde dehydrogenase
VEAFGPVSTLMPYKKLDEAIELAQMGKGSLCCSIATADNRIATEFTLGAASHHGRIVILNRECAKESTGHGSPLPLFVHGGPGRAGGGEEMGGAKHTVTEADITNFANVLGDNFYAHMDATSLEGTPFTGRVAHGYFILSKAAGLFVEAKKEPVLLNYGIDSCRFTKPVYPNMTIGVRLTVKEKIEQEQKTPEDIAKGIVKWRVEVYDETNETVALATILTMVKKRIA